MDIETIVLLVGGILLAIWLTINHYHCDDMGSIRN